MVKKQLKNGEPCRKCAQAEDMLRARGLWDHIDDVIWADENDPGTKRAMEAMLKMKKLDIATLEEARASVV